MLPSRGHDAGELSAGADACASPSAALLTAAQLIDLGVVHRGLPGDGTAPVVTDQHGRLGVAFADQTDDVGHQQAGVVDRDDRL